MIKLCNTCAFYDNAARGQFCTNPKLAVNPKIGLPEPLFYAVLKCKYEQYEPKSQTPAAANHRTARS